jgi:hypothetical protein
VYLREQLQAEQAAKAQEIERRRELLRQAREQGQL